MATNRKRTPRSRIVSALNPGEINFLYDRNDPLGDPWLDRHFMSKDEIKGLWTENRDEVLKWWIENKPCSRPGPWWIFDAPLEDTKTRFEVIKTQRRDRISGVGTPCYLCLNYCAQFTLGIPNSWVSQRDADYYNGRAKDIHGKPIGNNKEGDFEGLAIDPTDPPTFESQAAYLKRHGLLTTEEKRHLGKHPELLKPEAVTDEDAE